MSIPVTASTEAFTPACVAEIEGAPTFTFRHATVLDKHKFHNIAIAEGLIQHGDEEVREAIIAELRAGFTSEGMEQNITRLTAYWAANDEYASALRNHRSMVAEIMEAHEGDEAPALPPEPVLDFPETEVPLIEAMIAEVRRHRTRVNGMLADNQWFGAMYPRILMRMFLTATDLPVTLVKKHGLITAESAEEAIEALAEFAESNGIDSDLAVSQLLLEATLSFAMRKDEEKNSSSPRSGSTPPEQSASKQSSGLPAKTPKSSSTAPATSEEAHGLSSSDSESPALA